MNPSLLQLGTLANHALAFDGVARSFGFGSAGEIDRFLFQSYGKALRDLPAAGRPRGAIFFLEPPANPLALANPTAMKSAVTTIQTNLASRIYSIPLDLNAAPMVATDSLGPLKNAMSGGTWPLSAAQALSKANPKVLVWANGVGAVVLLAGDIYIQSVDVVGEMHVGLPDSFQSLPWDDGAIVLEFANHKLKDTTPAGIWERPGGLVLRPKPEKLMSVALGEFLSTRLAGYRHHEDESVIVHAGRVDVVVHLLDGRIIILEVKWAGRSLKSDKENEPAKAIDEAVKKDLSAWFTEYGDESFEAGIRQLAIYFGTGKYGQAVLAVFDCRAPDKLRPAGAQPIDPNHTAPHAVAHFRSYRACADPRKASTISKLKRP